MCHAVPGRSALLLCECDGMQPCFRCHSLWQRGSVVIYTGPCPAMLSNERSGCHAVGCTVVVLRPPNCSTKSYKNCISHYMAARHLTTSPSGLSARHTSTVFHFAAPLHSAGSMATSAKVVHAPTAIHAHNNPPHPRRRSAQCGVAASPTSPMPRRPSLCRHLAAKARQNEAWAAWTPSPFAMSMAFTTKLWLTMKQK